jgi:hypothetical protein
VRRRPSSLTVGRSARPDTREDIARGLRNQLGRKPTADEVKAEQDRQIGLRYAGMMVTDVMLRDEIEKRS